MSRSAWALLVPLLAVFAGCGTPTTAQPVRSLTGPEVGTMAERQLESEHPLIAPGEMLCPDLAFTVGASVRCHRTARLSQGRVVRIPGTVRVTSTEAGGSLHVQLDDRAEEWGVSGEALAQQLSSLWHQRIRSSAVVRCPYLRAEAGAAVPCQVSGSSGPVWVRVVTVTDADFRASYLFSGPGFRAGASVG